MITLAEAMVNIGRGVCRNGVFIGVIENVSASYKQIVVKLNKNGKAVFGLGSTYYWAEEGRINFNEKIDKEEIKKIITALEL